MVPRRRRRGRRWRGAGPRRVLETNLRRHVLRAGPPVADRARSSAGVVGERQLAPHPATRTCRPARAPRSTWGAMPENRLRLVPDLDSVMLVQCRRLRPARSRTCHPQKGRHERSRPLWLKTTAFLARQPRVAAPPGNTWRRRRRRSLFRARRGSTRGKTKSTLAHR